MQTAAPSSSAGGDVEGGGDGDTDARALQSKVDQLQLPPALTQEPSDDAAEMPVLHNPCDGEEIEEEEVHQPQSGDCVHALQDI